MNNVRHHADYIQDLDKFLQVVESDAISFKPLGKKIHAYTRSAHSSSGASDDIIEYEVYHVRFEKLSRFNKD